MKKTILFILCLVCASHLFAQDVSGVWGGSLDMGAVQLRLVFNLEKQENGSYTATMDSPDQGAKGIVVSTVSFENNVLDVAINTMAMTYTGTLTGDSIVGTFSQMGQNIPMNLKRGIVELNRPQEPIPPFVYNSEDVTFFNKEANINLAGTFTFPTSGSKFPVVVLITGSGPQNRNEELMGHKLFLVLSDYLTNKGIAVLRFDDRGVGESKGDFDTATSQDFGTDVMTAIEYLKGRKEINPKKIGLIGHSEGGLIAFMLAAQHKDIAFIVSMAGPGVSGREIIKIQSKSILMGEGTTEEAASENQKTALKMVDLVMSNSEDYLKENIEQIFLDFLPENSSDAVKKNFADGLARASSPWFRYFLAYDPINDIRKIKCPVFALNGEKDAQVDAHINLKSIEENLVKTKNKKIKEYPNLNHLFQTSTTGAVSEYSKIEETIAPVVLNDIAIWILNLYK